MPLLFIASPPLQFHLKRTHIGLHSTTEDSVWFVVDKKVYDATSYLKDHPGGAQSIVMNGGMDASEDFNAIHSTAAKAMLKDYLIGAVTGDEVSRTDTEVRAKLSPVCQVAIRVVLNTLFSPIPMWLLYVYILLHLPHPSMWKG